jgi:hypothetical protein
LCSRQAFERGGVVPDTNNLDTVLGDAVGYELDDPMLVLEHASLRDKGPEKRVPLRQACLNELLRSKHLWTLSSDAPARTIDCDIPSSSAFAPMAAARRVVR